MQEEMKEKMKKKKKSKIANYFTTEGRWSLSLTSTMSAHKAQHPCTLATHRLGCTHSARSPTLSTHKHKTCTAQKHTHTQLDTTGTAAQANTQTCMATHSSHRTAPGGQSSLVGSSNDCACSCCSWCSTVLPKHRCCCCCSCSLFRQW